MGASAHNPGTREVEEERLRVELHPWLSGSPTHGDVHSSSARVEKVSGSCPRLGSSSESLFIPPRSNAAPNPMDLISARLDEKEWRYTRWPWGKRLYGSEDYLLHCSAQNDAKCECGTLNHLWLPVWEVPWHGARRVGGLSSGVGLPGFKFYFLTSLSHVKPLCSSVSVSPLSNGRDNIYAYQIHRDMPVSAKSNSQKGTIHITTASW